MGWLKRFFFPDWIQRRWWYLLGLCLYALLGVIGVLADIVTWYRAAPVPMQIVVVALLVAFHAAIIIHEIWMLLHARLQAAIAAVTARADAAATDFSARLSGIETSLTTRLNGVEARLIKQGEITDAIVRRAWLEDVLRRSAALRERLERAYQVGSEGHKAAVSNGTMAIARPFKVFDQVAAEIRALYREAMGEAVPGTSADGGDRSKINMRLISHLILIDEQAKSKLAPVGTLLDGLAVAQGPIHPLHDTIEIPAGAPRMGRPRAPRPQPRT